MLRHPAVNNLKIKKQDKEELVNEMEFTEIDQSDSAKVENGGASSGSMQSDSGMRFRLNKHGQSFKPCNISFGNYEFVVKTS